MTDHEKIKKVVEDILEKMGVKFEAVSASEDSSGKRVFMIKSDDSGIIIGTKGMHISALNHVVKRIAGKQLGNEGEKYDFYIDVNDYHDKLAEEIKNKAKILADRARSFKVNVEMDPMSPYERMIVHTYFENVPDITTESKGEGDKRRVVLKYKAETEKF